MKAPSRVIRISFRYAMSFDGVDDYVVVPHNDVLNVATGNKITVTMWAYLTGWRVGYPLGVVIDKRTEVQANWNWEFNASNMYMRIHADNKMWGITMLHSLGMWNHYTMVLDGSRLSGYLNGELKVERNDVSSTGSNTVNLYICETTCGAYQTMGLIAEVHIYSRALSADEIAYNYSNPSNPIRNGLVLWLQAHPDNVKDIDGDGVLEWVDLSGYNNHGKIYGATLVEVIKAPSRVLAPSRILPPAR